MIIQYHDLWLSARCRETSDGLEHIDMTSIIYQIFQIINLLGRFQSLPVVLKDFHKIE